MGYIPEPEKLAHLIRQLREEFSNFSEGISVTIDRHPLVIKFTLRDKGIDIAGFTLTEQINCCGILVSTKTFVNHGYEGRGIAQEMMPLKEFIAKEFGYSLILATVDIGNNPAEVHILEKFGWTCTQQFINKRTKHNLGIYTKEIK